jgi:DNA-binding GntR family transcriptional regulator
MQIATLRQRAYKRLEQMLASGELGPDRELTELALAKTLGMSRTPVREALRQMEMEGVLEYAPHYGAVVRRLDSDELAEMYSVREALESQAAADAAERITPLQLETLRSLCKQMSEMSREVSRPTRGVLRGESLRAFVSADMEFHRIIVEASGNRFMVKILATTHLLQRVFKLTNWVYDKPALAEANRFHEMILKSLEARDADRARHWTAEAMRVSKHNALAQSAAIK